MRDQRQKMYFARIKRLTRAHRIKTLVWSNSRPIRLPGWARWRDMPYGRHVYMPLVARRRTTREPYGFGRDMRTHTPLSFEMEG